MVITRITYRRLVNTGNYQNETVEMEALIDEHESITDAFESLVSIVDAQLAKLADPDDSYSVELLKPPTRSFGPRT